MCTVCIVCIGVCIVCMGVCDCFVVIGVLYGPCCMCVTMCARVPLCVYMDTGMWVWVCGYGYVRRLTFSSGTLPGDLCW